MVVASRFWSITSPRRSLIWIRSPSTKEREPLLSSEPVKHRISSLVATTKATAMATMDNARVRSSSPQIITRPSSNSSRKPLRELTSQRPRNSGEFTVRWMKRVVSARRMTTVTIRMSELASRLKTPSEMTKLSGSQSTLSNMLRIPGYSQAGMICCHGRAVNRCAQLRSAGKRSLQLGNALGRPGRHPIEVHSGADTATGVQGKLRVTVSLAIGHPQALGRPYLFLYRLGIVQARIRRCQLVHELLVYRIEPGFGLLLLRPGAGVDLLGGQ